MIPVLFFTVHCNCFPKLEESYKEADSCSMCYLLLMIMIITIETTRKVTG